MERNLATFILFIILVSVTPITVSCGGGGGGTSSSVTSAVTTDTDYSEADKIEDNSEATDNGEASNDQSAQTEEPFMLVVIPDSQHTTVDFPYIFNEQMYWIAANHESENIAFVLHEGDVTHYNNESGWINASVGYEIIDGIIPHAIAVGNHDMDFPSSYDTSLMDAYFPASRYENEDSFLESYPTGTLNNSAHIFSAGGTDWLVLSIRYAATSDIFAWADSVVAANPLRRIIVITHAFVQPDGTIGRDAQTLWDDFASRHSAITFVFNGHYTSGEAGRATFTGDYGNPVYAFFANYQKNQYGGFGYTRLVTLDTEAETVSVKTYSPWLDEYLSDSENEFFLTGVDMSALD